MSTPAAAAAIGSHGHTSAAHEEVMPSTLGLPHAKLAIWLFLVTEVMFFAGLIGAYVVLRFGTPGWPNPYDILAVRVTAFNTFLLICSSVTMVKAFQWSDAGNHGRAMGYLAATIVGGASFVGIQVYEYGHLFEKPSAALLEHVEELMTERGMTVPEHGAATHEEHASAIDGAIGTAEGAVIVQASQGENSQNEVLTTAYTLLSEGRPAIAGAGPSRLAAEERAAEWDKKIFNEVCVPLKIAFPEDAMVQKLGLHHNLFPEGFVPWKNVFTSTFYIMTSFHGTHVSLGVIWLIVVLVRYWHKPMTSSIENVGLYWHFVDLVWIILFTIVYLM